MRQSMEEGALGVTSALIYAPATFANMYLLVAVGGRSINRKTKVGAFKEKQVF
jgi:hypothetical protein